MDSIAMERLVESLPTKAAKIRALDAKGVPRADIARFLGIRYQHVRNTLEQSRAPRNGAEAPSTALAEGAGRFDGSAPGDVSRRPLQVDAEGRLTLPPDMLAAMMLRPGDGVTARVEDGELRVIAPPVAIRRAQRIASKYKRPDESVVDEFLAERRAMWGEE